MSVLATWFFYFFNKLTDNKKAGNIYMNCIHSPLFQHLYN
ncbi:hypothetical protein HMPREF9505_00891 [Enterococcus faecalis TX0109]|nr:hypothetical protein HMPREF9505_00891 [Enterococcus faecalis TX0109]